MEGAGVGVTGGAGEAEATIAREKSAETMNLACMLQDSDNL